MTQDQINTPAGPPPDPDSNPGMLAPGSPLADAGENFAGFENYWGTDETEKVYLADGKQYFVIQPMNEGAKTKYQKMTTKDVVLQQKTGDARMSVDPAGERHTLIKSSVIDWYLMQLTPNADPRQLSSWTQAPFSPRSLEQWLDKANPKAVERLEDGIRKLNPWLQADMTLADVDEELERLYTLRKEIEARDSGEASSANK